MFNKYIETQHVCISVSEVFDWWDRLDALKDTPEKAFDLFKEFLEQAEDTLDIDPKIFEDDLSRDEYVKVDLYEDIYDYGNLTYNPYNWTIKEKK